MIIIKSINGGKADKLSSEDLVKKYGISREEFSKKLKMGIKIEREHTCDPGEAEEIAMDHLSERFDYYDKLESSGLADELKKSLSQEQKTEIEKFFTGKKKVEDEEFHKFVEGLGINPHHAEEYVYELLMNKAVPKDVYQHSDKLGSGAKKRKKLKNLDDKFQAVMGEFKRGTLHSGSGQIVTDRKQALAIAASEAGISKAIDSAFWSNKIGETHLSQRETIQAIRDMIVAEYEAIQLYERFAESINDMNIRGIIMDITNEEKVHVGEFQKLLATLEPKEIEKYEEGEEEAEDSMSVNRMPVNFVKAIIQRARKSKIEALRDLANEKPEDDDYYKLQGKRKCHGMEIEIENKKGSVRRGTDPGGHKWETKMNFDYGRIVGAKGSDGESLDAYIGPDTDSDMIYVIHQNDPESGRFDENKIMIYFPTVESAVEGYMSQYDRPDFFGGVSEYPVEDFKKEIESDSGKMLYRSPILIKSKDKPMIIIKSKTVKEGGKVYTTAERSDRRTPPKGYPKDMSKYLDPKNLKYPIDTEKHVRAAMSYFSAHDNEYSTDQRKKMWSKLIGVAKKMGIDVSDEVKKRAE